MVATLEQKEIVEKRWDKLREFIWTELEKEWPYFWSDDIQELSFYVKEFCNISEGPEDLEKPVLIDNVNKYLDNHTLSLSLLTDKYKDLGVDKEVFEVIDHHIHIDWYVGGGRGSFSIEQGEDFRNNVQNYFGVMKEQFGFSTEKAEMIAMFAGPDIKTELLKQARDWMCGEYNKFQTRWEPTLKKEVKKANKILLDIVDNRMFDENGNIKQEIFIEEELK